ncbi:MAG: HAMP domain-containing sensor histidine kinase [Ruthenibacterium sp.]
MIQKLRRRMTVMMSTLTSLVLLAALCLTFYIAQAQYKNNMNTLLENNVAGILEKLSSGQAISDKWLAAQEMKSLCVIAITDNGTPFQFGGAWIPQTSRDVLLARCEKAVADSMVLTQNLREQSRAQFTIHGDANETYRVSMAQLRQNKGQTVQLCVLQDMAAMTLHLRRLLLTYGLIALFGAAILTVIAWLLSGVAAKPTALAIKQQNEFVAAASHELRSPLSVIKASLAAANEADLPPEQVCRFYQTAQNEADRMTRLVDDLLLLAGGDAKALRLQKSVLSTDTFCIELYEKFHLLAQTHGHTLVLTLPDAPLPEIHADEARLTQLFSVLLSNAIEYTQIGTPLEIVAAADKKGVKISVIDHGKGIAAADKTQIFTRFYRSDKSRSDKAHFGLGLAVAQEIAAMHDASLTLTDTAGGGCTFTLAFVNGSDI